MSQMTRKEWIAFAIILPIVAVATWSFVMAIGVPDSSSISADCDGDRTVSYVFPTYYYDHGTYYTDTYCTLSFGLSEDVCRDSLRTPTLRDGCLTYTYGDFLGHLPYSSVDMCNRIADELNAHIRATEDMYGIEYTDWQRMMVVAVFVWTAVDYVSDDRLYGVSEWWAYPYETLYFGKGDCEDTAILCMQLCKAMGLDAIILKQPHHALCGVEVEPCWHDDTFTYEGKTYVCVETTLDMTKAYPTPNGISCSDVWKEEYGQWYNPIVETALYYPAWALHRLGIHYMLKY